MENSPNRILGDNTILVLMDFDSLTGLTHTEG